METTQSKVTVTMNITDLYIKYKSDILTYTTFKVKNLVVAEEITDDVFIKANKYLADYDSTKSAIKTWLFHITNSSIIDYFRTAHLKRTVSYDNYLCHDNDTRTYDIGSMSDVLFFNTQSECKTDSLVDTKDFNKKINRIFDGMKPNYKKVAELYYIKDLSYNDIAKVCNIPLGSVKGMISRCKALLQSELQVEKAEYGIK